GGLRPGALAAVLRSRGSGSHRERTTSNTDERRGLSPPGQAQRLALLSGLATSPPRSSVSDKVVPRRAGRRSRRRDTAPGLVAANSPAAAPKALGPTAE